MTRTNNNYFGRPFRRPDKQNLVAVRYQDGTSAYIRVRREIAAMAPKTMAAALQRQLDGEIPPGEIVAVVRVH
jgi:hypothetical protein